MFSQTDDFTPTQPYIKPAREEKRTDLMGARRASARLQSNLLRTLNQTLLMLDIKSQPGLQLCFKNRSDRPESERQSGTLVARRRHWVDVRYRTRWTAVLTLQDADFGLLCDVMLRQAGNLIDECRDERPGTAYVSSSRGLFRGDSHAQKAEDCAHKEVRVVGIHQ